MSGAPWSVKSGEEWETAAAEQKKKWLDQESAKRNQWIKDGFLDPNGHTVSQAYRIKQLEDMGITKKDSKENEEEAPPWEEDDTSKSPEKPWYSVSGKGLLKGIAESAPTAGAVFGGALATPSDIALGPYGTVFGAGLGYGAGTAVKNFIEQSFLDEPKTREQVLTEPFKEIPTGAVYEMGGQALTRGVGNMLGTIKQKPTDLVPKGLVQSVQAEKYEPTPNIFDPRPKPNAEQIQSSARNLGFNATPGMLSQNPNIHDLESSLANSPTLSGEKVRKSYEPVYQGMKEAVPQIIGESQKTPVEAGETLRKGLLGRIESKMSPLEDSFQNIRESSTNIRPQPDSLKRAADRLRSQPLAEFSQLPQGSAIHKYADAIEQAKSLDSLKQLRSSAGAQQTQAYRSGNAIEASAYGKVINSIRRLERREIIKSAMDTMPTQESGKQAAQDLIGQIKSTNKGWSVLMDQLQDLGSAGGINKQIKNPRQLMAIIDDMPAEDLSRKFFDTGNYKGLQTVKQFAPEEFESIREAKLSDIANRSKINGEVSPKKLVTNLQKIGPEARQILLGPKAEATLQDLGTVAYNVPDNINPSKTSKGNVWMQFIMNPARWAHWGDEAGSAYSYMLLQGKGVPRPSGIASRASNVLSSRPLSTPIGGAAYGGLRSGIKGLISPNDQEEEAPPWED